LSAALWALQALRLACNLLHPETAPAAHSAALPQTRFVNLASHAGKAKSCLGNGPSAFRAGRPFLDHGASLGRACCKQAAPGSNPPTAARSEVAARRRWQPAAAPSAAAGATSNAPLRRLTVWPWRKYAKLEPDCGLAPVSRGYGFSETRSKWASLWTVNKLALQTKGGFGRNNWNRRRTTLNTITAFVVGCVEPVPSVPLGAAANTGPKKKRPPASNRRQTQRKVSPHMPKHRGRAELPDREAHVCRLSDDSWDAESSGPGR
jgi:hypothetical protein